MISVRGIPEVQKMLAELPLHLRASVIKEAVEPAGEYLEARIAMAAPVATGRLSKSITTSLTQNHGEPVATVKPNRKRGGGGRHAHLVEWPTKPHTVGGKFAGAQHPGTRGQPFFWPTFESLRDSLYSMVADVVRGGWEAYWTSRGGEVG